MIHGDNWIYPLIPRFNWEIYSVIKQGDYGRFIFPRTERMESVFHSD